MLLLFDKNRNDANTRFLGVSEHSVFLFNQSKNVSNCQFSKFHINETSFFNLTVEFAQLSNFLGSSRASNSYKNVFILGEYVQNPPDIQLVRIQALGNS